MFHNDIKDMSMLDLFQMELVSQCQTITAKLATLAKHPSSLESTKEILRAIHSIKGAAAIIDITALVDLTKKTEEALSTYEFYSAGAHTQFLNALGEITAFLEKISLQDNDTLIQWLDDEHEHVSKLSQSIASYQTTDEIDPNDHEDSPSTQEGPESAPPLRVDLSMFDIFKDDAATHSRNLSNNLLQLENRPNDLLAIESSMRSTHSIKGAARVIGLPPVVELTHAMEEVFMAAQRQNSPLHGSHIDLLFGGIDFLNDLISVQNGRLNLWLRENSKKGHSLVMALDSAAKETISPQQTTPESRTKQRKPNDIPQQLLSEEKSSSSNFIKISPDGLNHLIGLTGEMLAEAKWQPSLLKKSYEIKRKVDQLLKQMDGIRKKFHTSHFDKNIEESFKLLHQEDISYHKLISSFISEVEEHTRTANEVSHRLHKELINNRMQPFSEGIKDFPRMVRDLARSLKKDIILEIDGSETMVDREILDLIKSPLTHLVSNAIDHGIESPEERTKAGKSKHATIRIEAKHLFGVLQIIIADDGQGIDIETLRNVIVSRKLVSKKIAQELQENELLEFLFLPNFSTRKKASHISGRGVGLDVVQSIIREIRGSVHISTIQGTGTIFELQLPLTLSMSKCLIVLINNEVYAFPLVRIDRVTKIPASEIKELAGHQYFTHDTIKIGLVSAQQVLDLREPESRSNELKIIILQNNTKNYGIIVDEVVGIRDLMVQPLTSRLGKLRSVSTASIGEDGTPILILDTQDLIQSMDHLISGDKLHPIDHLNANNGDDQIQTILVVDDSATVREVEKKLLQKDGYKVITAVDGVDGWQKVQQHKFDLIITDIDMPHMDGIELVLQIRDDDRFESMPIIIVSYKNREEDRNRGLEAGADYYLTKGSFQDQTLLDAVTDLIGLATSPNESPRTHTESY